MVGSRNVLPISLSVLDNEGMCSPSLELGEALGKERQQLVTGSAPASMHGLLSPPPPCLCSGCSHILEHPPHLTCPPRPSQSRFILPGSLTWKWPAHLPQWPGICSSPLTRFSLLVGLSSAHPYCVFLMRQGLGRLMSLEETELPKGPPMFNSSSNRGSLAQCVWHLAGNQ